MAGSDRGLRRKSSGTPKRHALLCSVRKFRQSCENHVLSLPKDAAVQEILCTASIRTLTRPLNNARQWRVAMPERPIPLSRATPQGYLHFTCGFVDACHCLESVQGAVSEKGLSAHFCDGLSRTHVMLMTMRRCVGDAICASTSSPASDNRTNHHIHLGYY